MAPTVADALSQTAKLDPSNQPGCLLIQNFHRGRDKLGFDVDPTALDPGLHAGLPEDLAHLQARPSPGRRASGMAGAESLRLGRGGQGVAPRRPPPTATTRQPRDIATPRTHRYRRGAIPGPPCDRSHCRRDATNPQRASSVMPCPVGESGQENSTDNAKHLPAQRYAQLFAFGR